MRGTHNKDRKNLSSSLSFAFTEFLDWRCHLQSGLWLVAFICNTSMIVVGLWFFVEHNFTSRIYCAFQILLPYSYRKLQSMLDLKGSAIWRRVILIVSIAYRDWFHRSDDHATIEIQTNRKNSIDLYLKKIQIKHDSKYMWVNESVLNYLLFLQWWWGYFLRYTQSTNAVNEYFHSWKRLVFHEYLETEIQICFCQTYLETRRLVSGILSSHKRPIE